MHSKTADSLQNKFKQKLLDKGLRPTKQRSCVYDVLLQKKDHPTADEVLVRVRKKLPSISLATVYNCLETLVDCSLVKQVNMDRSPSKYCPNLTPHAHFRCSKTGRIYDLNLQEDEINQLKELLPSGFNAENFDLTFSGSANLP